MAPWMMMMMMTMMIFVTTGYGCQIWSFNVNVLAVAMFVSGARNE